MNFSLFDTMPIPLLPAFSPPFQEELFSSWLTRMAYDHGLPLADFCKLVGVNGKHKRDLDLYVPDEAIRQLAQQTKLTTDQVAAMMMSGYHSKLVEQSNQPERLDRWFFRKYDPLGNTVRGSLLYCPKCLSNHHQEPYFRKHWRLAFSFVCLTCQCYLLDQCPHCKKAVTLLGKTMDTHPWRNAAEYMVHCGYCVKHLAAVTPDVAPSFALKTQQELYDILEHGFNERAFYPLTYFRVLHHLSTLLITRKAKLVRDARKNLLPLIGRLYEQHKVAPIFSPREEVQVQFLPIQQRAQVLQIAVWWLQDWPRRFLDLAKRHGLQSVDIIGQFKNPPFWFWEPVIHQLIPPLTPALKEVPFGFQAIFTKPRNRAKKKQEIRKIKKYRQKQYGIS